VTAINAGLAYALRRRPRPDPGRRSASGSWPSHGSVTMEIDWMAAKELNAAILPICSAFIANLWLRARAA
jgi:hypothetical protein